ncbi:MAG: Spy/CpxP family protein refolding chaperone [Thermodesulfobacteriota bacterium]
MKRMSRQSAEIGARHTNGLNIALAIIWLSIWMMLAGGCGGRTYEKPDYYKGFDPNASSLSPKMGRQTNYILQQIEATDEQRAKINSHLNDLASESAKVTKEYKMLMDRLITAFEDENMNRQGFEVIRDERLERFKSSSDRMVDAIASIHEQLTPEQRRKVAELWRKKGER